VLKNLLRLALVVFLVVTCAGARCDRTKPPPPPARNNLSRAEYFKQTRIDVNTPQGKIDMDSVVETPDGVEYKTADGSRWRVVMEKTGDGYRVKSAEPVKATP
jgi:hypothetical protein